jgi:hypothetical protein
MTRFPRTEAESIALVQAMVSGLTANAATGKELEYRIIVNNKSGDGEPSNTAMVVL